MRFLTQNWKVMASLDTSSHAVWRFSRVSLLAVPICGEENKDNFFLLFGNILLWKGRKGWEENRRKKMHASSQKPPKDGWRELSWPWTEKQLMSCSELRKCLTWQISPLLYTRLPLLLFWFENGSQVCHNFFNYFLKLWAYKFYFML